jgi:hypothetical protein
MLRSDGFAKIEANAEIVECLPYPKGVLVLRGMILE